MDYFYSSIDYLDGNLTLSGYDVYVTAGPDGEPVLTAEATDDLLPEIYFETREWEGGYVFDAKIDFPSLFSSDGNYPDTFIHNVVSRWEEVTNELTNILKYKYVQETE